MSSEPRNPRNCYLRILIRLTRDGGYEILEASEHSGKVALRQSATHPFVYEVSAGAQIVSGETVADDPFTIRGFLHKGDDRGHHVQHADSATVVLKIPSMNLNEADRTGLAVTLFESKQDGKTVRFNASKLGDRRLLARVEIPPGALRPHALAA